MNNQPTPDTDERSVPHIGFYSCATVPAEFARKLERERDEARQKYDNLATEHMLAVNKICNERDEAREEAHRFRSLHYSHLGINGSASWFPWEAK
jgi:hypothetical protein